MAATRHGWVGGGVQSSPTSLPPKTRLMPAPASTPRPQSQLSVTLAVGLTEDDPPEADGEASGRLRQWAQQRDVAEFLEQLALLAVPYQDGPAARRGNAAAALGAIAKLVAQPSAPLDEAEAARSMRGNGGGGGGGGGGGKGPALTAAAIVGAAIGVALGVIGALVLGAVAMRHHQRRAAQPGGGGGGGGSSGSSRRLVKPPEAGAPVGGTGTALSVVTAGPCSSAAACGRVGALQEGIARATVCTQEVRWLLVTDASQKGGAYARARDLLFPHVVLVFPPPLHPRAPPNSLSTSPQQRSPVAYHPKFVAQAAQASLLARQHGLPAAEDVLEPRLAALTAGGQLQHRLGGGGGPAAACVVGGGGDGSSGGGSGNVDGGGSFGSSGGSPTRALRQADRQRGPGSSGAPRAGMGDELAQPGSHVHVIERGDSVSSAARLALHDIEPEEGSGLAEGASTLEASGGFVPAVQASLTSLPVEPGSPGAGAAERGAARPRGPRPPTQGAAPIPGMPQLPRVRVAQGSSNPVAAAVAAAMAASGNGSGTPGSSRSVSSPFASAYNFSSLT
jgi:hypothetical protein